MIAIFGLIALLGVGAGFMLADGLIDAMCDAMKERG